MRDKEWPSIQGFTPQIPTGSDGPGQSWELGILGPSSGSRNPVPGAIPCWLPKSALGDSGIMMRSWESNSCMARRLPNWLLSCQSKCLPLNHMWRSGCFIWKIKSTLYLRKYEQVATAGLHHPMTRQWCLYPHVPVFPATTSCPFLPAWTPGATRIFTINGTLMGSFSSLS